MSHRPLYAKKNHRWWLWGILLATAVVLWRYYVFSPEKIIEKSELKNKVFEARVEEVIAPKSGVKAYLLQEKSNPIVSMEFIFANSGSIRDIKKGTANFVAEMLTEGAGDLDAQNFKEKLEDYAINIVYDVDKDDFSGSLLTIKENLPLAIKLLRDTLMAPRLEVEDVARIKSKILQNIEYMREKPQGRLLEAVNKEIFGNHSYAYNVLGKKEAVQEINVTDLREFIKDNLVKDRLFVGIAGDISKSEAEFLIDDVFADLGQTTNGKEIENPKIDYSARNIDVEDIKLPQILTMITAPSVARLDRDFYPLYVANYIFGGAGLNSRLNQAAREKEGLTYGAYTSMSLLKRAPQLSGGFATTPDKFIRMREIFVEEWSKMGRDGVTEEELRSAKNYLLNSYNLRFADIGTLAAILASMQRENLGIDFLQKRNLYVDNVSLERVNQVVKQYFSPNKLIMINMGNTKKENINE